MLDFEKNPFFLAKHPNGAADTIVPWCGEGSRAPPVCRLVPGPAVSQWLSILQKFKLNGKHLTALPWTCFGFQGN